MSLNQFSSVLTNAISAVTPALDTRGKGKSVVVFNPLSTKREDVVELSVLFDDQSVSTVQVIGPDNKEVPSQVISASNGAVHLLFRAKVPSVGYAVYDIRPSTTGYSETVGAIASQNGLENQRYKLTLNGNGDVYFHL